MGTKTLDPTVIAVAEAWADAFRLVDQIPYNPADESGTWLQHVACGDTDPELFHPASDFAEVQIMHAQSRCDRCPVAEWCRQRRYELGATGVWAGVFYDKPGGGQRPCAMSGCSEPVRAARAHYCGFECEHAAKAGTDGGYRLHQRESVPACQPCKDAQNRRNQRYKDSREGAHGTHKPSVMRSGARVAS